MAAVFNFDDICDITINGHDFKVDIGGMRGERLQALNDIQKDIMRVNDLVKEKGEEAATKEFIEIVCRGIDNILGMGASFKVFMGITPTPLRCVSVVTFIAREMEKCKLKKVAAVNKAKKQSK